MEAFLCLTSALCMQVGMFQVLLLQRTPQRAYSLLQPLEPFTPFRDPSMGSSLFDLTVYHCIAVSSLRPSELQLQPTRLLESSHGARPALLEAQGQGTALNRKVWCICRESAEQRRLGSWTGTCPAATSIWQNMNIMSRSRTEI